MIGDSMEFIRVPDKQLREKIREGWRPVRIIVGGTWVNYLMRREVQLQRGDVIKDGKEVWVDMEKTPKAERVLEDISQRMFGRSRQDPACVTCGSDEILPQDFRDDLSRREFKISHMCQKCQDGVFGT